MSLLYPVSLNELMNNENMSSICTSYLFFLYFLDPEKVPAKHCFYTLWYYHREGELFPSWKINLIHIWLDILLKNCYKINRCLNIWLDMRPKENSLPQRISNGWIWENIEKLRLESTCLFKCWMMVLILSTTLESS